MPFTSLIAFDRPLASAIVKGQQGRYYTEGEIAALTQQAYHRGGDDARAATSQQIVEMRVDLEGFRDSAFSKIPVLEKQFQDQLQEALPSLTVEIARRLLAGFEPDASTVNKLCTETLAQLFPERDNLELSLNSRDYAMLTRLSPDWLERYPGLKIREDASLKPGDCLVRSRFGLTDARLDTKLNALSHALAGQ